MAIIRLTDRYSRLSFLLSTDEIVTVERTSGSHGMETTVSLRNGRMIAVEEKINDVEKKIEAAQTPTEYKTPGHSAEEIEKLTGGRT